MLFHRTRIASALAAVTTIVIVTGCQSAAATNPPPANIGAGNLAPAPVTFALPTYAQPPGQPQASQPTYPPPAGQQGQPPQGGPQQGGQQQGGQQLSRSYPAPTPSSGLASGGMVDLHNLTIGTKIVTSPERGGLYSCQTTFTGGGASATGAWYHNDGTYDLTIKPTVDGSVSWPHELSITVNGSSRVFTGNDLPDHNTGTYPISRSDDAYQYDRNPNSISAQTVLLELPANPQIAPQPQCSAGMTGIFLTGAYVFNAVDAGGRDAVATEIQDPCGGHPQSSGAYHYHGYSPCVNGDAKTHALIGYALDGFGIYGPYDANGGYLSNADLDECHGHLRTVDWDGAQTEIYHYHANYEFPYTVGCFRGAPTRVNGGGGQGGQQSEQPGGGGPGGQPGGGDQGGPPPP